MLETFVIGALWFITGCGFAAFCRLVYLAAYHWDMLKRDRLLK